MDLPVFGLLLVVSPALTAALSMMAHLVVDRWKTRDENREKIYVDYRYQQIVQLYAPLSQLLLHRKQLVWLTEQQAEDKARFFIERRFIDPVETEIDQLIQTKSHLFSEGVIPQECKAFRKYALGVKLGQLADLEGIPNPGIFLEYPENLDQVITDQLQSLTRSYERYLTANPVLMPALPKLEAAAQQLKSLKRKSGQ